MSNDVRMKFKYRGYSTTDTEGEHDVIVQIGDKAYHELRYLLAFACEEMENFCHIEDAVNLRNSLDDAWQMKNKQVEEDEG